MFATMEDETRIIIDSGSYGLQDIFCGTSEELLDGTIQRFAFLFRAMTLMP